MITDLLLKFGLGEKEISLYLALIQQGKASATELSKITKINRTTVYSVSKELIGKGLITEDSSISPSIFIPIPPQDLKNLILKDEQQLEHRKNLINQVIPELFSIAKNTEYSPPKIIFKAESDLESYLRVQTSVWTKSLMQYDKIMWGFQDPTFVEHYQSFIDWQWKNVAPSNTEFRFLSNKSEIETEMSQKQYDRRQIKYWEGAVNFSASTWICGDFIVMCMTKSKPHYLIEIFDKTMAHNYRELFKGLWNMIPEKP